MADFPIGSVVMLKSGGPKMTVILHDKSEVDEKDTFTHQCIWFELSDDNYAGPTNTRFFPPEALILVASASSG
jgi:uncharacterized protein YodC (DUF2158 family)